MYVPVLLDTISAGAPRYWTPGALSASVTRYTMQGWFYTNEGVIGVTRYPWSRRFSRFTYIVHT